MGKMIELFDYLFGHDDHVNIWQMSTRGLICFFFALILIRVAGRRTFGLGAPFDNVILVLLGAILAQGVIGRPFIPILGATFSIALLHRLLAYLSYYFHFLGLAIKGKKFILYENETFIQTNLRRSLVSERDIMEAVRLRMLDNSLNQVDKIFMERSGQISILKK